MSQAKGLYELSIFLIAIVAGTACSIFQKILYQLEGWNGSDDGEQQLEHFDKPLFQTTTMFLSMVLGVPLHWIVLYWFPGYQQHSTPTKVPKRQRHTEYDAYDDAVNTGERKRLLPAVSRHSGAGTLNGNRGDDVDKDLSGKCPPGSRSLPVKAYFIMALLSAFDLGATALCTIGLLYLNVSVYQMLRGSGIIFVALLRQFALGQRLYRFHWVGVLFNVLSVFLVGGAALRDATIDDAASASRGGEEGDQGHGHGHGMADALYGVVFMLLGTLSQSMQFALEEKMLVHDDITVPPLLLFGMEGVWGFVFCVCILYPVGYTLPGDDHGSYEDPFNTLAMLWNTPILQLFVALYMLSIFCYNLFAVLVTSSLSSVWHSILDNFRPMTVWGTDLVIYYCTVGGFGEGWTSSSWIQLVGLVILVYGTAIYNGSIRLKGQWYSLGIDLGYEYKEIESEDSNKDSESESA